MFNCKLCNYSNNFIKNYTSHCNALYHLEKEKISFLCCLCDKQYKSFNAYRKHKRNSHENKINKSNIQKINNNLNLNNFNINNNTPNNTFNNNFNKIKDKIKEEIKEEINKSKEEVKEEIIKSKEEVKTVVNKAITKATSLIKYLMEHHQNVPPIKKITNKESIKLLRIDYDCPIIKPNDFALERALVYDHSKGRFVKNISKSLLNIINHKKPKKQPIYNTDCTRYNYVIKTTSEAWDEDKAGIKFSEYIIKPFLTSIGTHIREFRIKELDSVNMRNNTLNQNEKYLDALSKTLNLESDIMNESLIGLILKELSPHLRYLQSEIEDLEKYNEMINITSELEDIIKQTNSDDNNNSDDSDNNSDNSDNNSDNSDISDDSDDSDNNSDYSDNNDNYVRKYRKRLL